METPIDITRLLDAVGHGDPRAQNELYELVYPQLRDIARSHRRRWQGDDTLNTTALIHETYLKLTRQVEPSWQSRSHFFATAAKAMRQVLVNYAERRQAAKRGGGVAPVPLEEDMLADEDTVIELLALHRALEELEAEHPRPCQVAVCRVFGGMSNEEIGQALGISVATVKRDWALASVALYRHVKPGSD